MTSDEELQGRLKAHDDKIAMHEQAIARHDQALIAHSSDIAALKADDPMPRRRQTWAAVKAVGAKYGSHVLVGILSASIALGTVSLKGCVQPDPTPPAPIPTPTPVPPLPPVPPTPPAPIPVSGLHVLISYAKATLTPDQMSGVVNGREVRDYLEAKCVVDPDTKDKAYWIIPSSSDVSGCPGWVRDAWQKHPAGGSWMVVSNGTAGYDGPIPATKAAALTILKQYGDAP
jgi:hypothetical protein